MATYHHSDFVRTMKERFVGGLTSALRSLLQEKHLYQSVLVPRTDGYVLSKPNNERSDEREPEVTVFIDNPWSLDPPSPPGVNICQLTPPDLKLFCSGCERIEAYNLVYAEDIFRRIQARGYQERNGAGQTFAFGYRCQSCKGTPEVFLVRRRGLRVTNEGRSPIEHVEVPSFIPKPVQRFLSGAIVAHQSGETLAGNFLLRTLIEQWARSSSGSKKDQADLVMDDYMATLPGDFKTRFPSMRTLYGDLSADIHTATGSPELFEKARGQIVEHFDARRMFKIV